VRTLAKKVRVNPYQKSNGTRVRGYVREDPRASVKGTSKELPPEDQRPSFFSEGIEPEEDKESEEGKEGD